ncbi:MAG: Eco57I restriction-modification methylase domain-containing protein [Candidatus Competibacteraceae bacterium]
MNLLQKVDSYRLEASRKLDPERRSALGQFMTPEPVARFMASLFGDWNGNEIRLLDAGAGVGSLTAAFIAEICQRSTHPERIVSTVYELEPTLIGYLEKTLDACRKTCQSVGIHFSSKLLQEDFIHAGSECLVHDLFSKTGEESLYTHAILNPPYKKIHSLSNHRLQLRAIGVETSNLYTAFLAIAIKLLEPGGELVAITPRSFCNGPYFKPFRTLFLNTMTLKHIHVFEKRDQAFKEDEVLQENIIFHATKGATHGNVAISASRGLDMADMSIQEVAYATVVKPDDPDCFIHIATNAGNRNLVERIEKFRYSLDELGIQVSTGPVVDFRLKECLRAIPELGTVPLIYPTHFQHNFILWPKPNSRKPNAILDTESSCKWLMPNGYYTIVRRFSAKEERRRVVAAVHDPMRVAGEKIGFENHLNIFHRRGAGLSPMLAKGLAVYLNSTPVDLYFRQFNGHTQVNASDLRMLRYPEQAVLERLGSHVSTDVFPCQAEIDALVERELD